MALIGALIILFPTTAHADSKSSTSSGSLKCAKTKATAHSTLQVSTPTSILKKFPSQITFVTNCGNIVVTPNTKAPVALTAISALALAGYYDKSLCHRLTTSGIYVLQCGDPTASGSGSPTGWTGYIDENLPKAGGINYPAGTVAMANSGPKTNGSQFFLVYKDTALGPNYTIWGKITKGLDLVKKIGAVGAYQMQGEQAFYAGDGYPIQMVEIVKASAK